MRLQCVGRVRVGCSAHGESIANVLSPFAEGESGVSAMGKKARKAFLRAVAIAKSRRNEQSCFSCLSSATQNIKACLAWGGKLRGVF